MSLSSLIVQREIATIRQVEEALARQVLYGGDLATNLLEVAPVEEWRIAVTLADSYALPAAPPGALAIGAAETLALLSSEVASRFGIVPLSGDATKLIVAASAPLRAEDIEMLAAEHGARVDPRVALDVRVREGLLRAYGVPLDRRIERLLAKLAQRGETAAPAPVRMPSAAPYPRPPSVPPFKLSHAYGVTAPRSPLAPQNRDETPASSDAEIDMPVASEPIAASVPDTDPSPAPSMSSTPIANAPTAPDATDDTLDAPDEWDAPIANAEPIASAPIASVPPESARFAAREPASRSRHITRMGFPPAPAQAPVEEAQPAPVNVPAPPKRATGEYVESKPTFVKATTNAVRPVRRRRGPLTAETAAEELDEATDREALLDLFFEFARQFFDYSALFIAHGDIAEGRDAFGDGAPRERVVGIGVPLDMPSMLQAAREQKEPLVVRPSAEGIDGVLLTDLRRPKSVEALILPLLVRGRTVALLYADVSTSLDRDAVDQVSAFAKSIGQGFERLIVRKKLAGFSSGAPDSRVGKLDASSISLPERKSVPSPGSAEKVTRAAALGRALFTPESPTQKSAGRASDPAPQASSSWGQSDRAPSPSQSPEQKTTSPETPNARGSLPAVLSKPPIAPRTATEMKETPVAPAVARAKHASSKPPPPQAAALRRTSGPPIPREEPEIISAELDIEETLDEPSSATREREADADVQSETLDDAAAQALLAEISASELPIAEDGEEVLVDVPPAVPESEQAVSVGPRRPPVAHSEASLPSIIVDIAGELSALVERVLAGNDDGQAEAELLRQGASAMPAIMARFPGPLLRARAELAEPLPRASDCGPLLRLIARQRKVALAYLLEEVASPDVARRFWGTFLLAELPYAEGARLLVPRLFDPDAKIRLVARAAARAMAESSHEALLGEIGRIIREPNTSRTARLGLLEALGDMREGKAVALLIGHVSDDDAEIATVTRRSLIVITRQDFGLDTRKWLSWWGQNSARHRVEWLIDALVDETPGIRRAAGDELKVLTLETFGYYDDLPKRERERAQQRFRDWWASEGRARFVRS